jgi:hypothetical protein
MARMFSLTAAITLVLGAAVSAATIDDIRELARAGLSDDVLVALVESDATVYELTASEIVELREAGVGERVVIAMLRNGREKVASDSSFFPPTAVVGVPVPQFAPHLVPQFSPHLVPQLSPHLVPNFVPFSPFVSTVPFSRFRHREPVYWGWGGQRRPDTWDPPRREFHRR